ncbi:hypothetical protein FM107_04200 [Sphingobacterium sp. JB170]|nr:hypothetical protein FM107_04200 [Sphingobacterium sp. JB170]
MNRQYTERYVWWCEWADGQKMAIFFPGLYILTLREFNKLLLNR